MKFNFHPEVKKLISEISNLSILNIDKNEINKPIQIVTAQSYELEKQRKSEKISNKEYAKIRRQISFLFDLFSCCSKVAEKQVALKTNPYELKYILFLTEVKSLNDGSGLDKPSLTKLAFLYGVVSLSSYEVEKLIELNKKKI